LPVVAATLVGSVVIGCSTGPRTVDVAVAEIESPAIEPRADARAVWTGDEMIVFGGRSTFGDDRWWVDGAVYNPASADWRTLPPFPHPDALPDSVAWTGDEMIVVGFEGGHPGTGPVVAAAYNPTTDAWRSVSPPGGFDTARAVVPQPPPDTETGIHTEPGPSVTGVDGRVFMAAGGRLLSWDPAIDSWVQPLSADVGSQQFAESSSPVRHGDRIYQGLARRIGARHGLAIVDAATAEVVSVEDLSLPDNIVGPLHPVFDGDELLLLGVQSIGSQPRKATVLAEGDNGWEIVAQTDDENFAGVATGDYKTLVPGDDALYSLHFNIQAGVFSPSDRTFGILDLDKLDRCALGSATVWTKEALIGWNGGHCRHEPIYEFEPEADKAVKVTLR